MNPYLTFAKSGHLLVDGANLKHTYAKSSYLGSQLPKTDRLYHILVLQAHHLRALTLPLAGLFTWSKLGALDTLDMYIDVTNKETGQIAPAAVSHARFNSFNQSLEIAIEASTNLFQDKTKVEVRVRSSRMFVQIDTGRIKNGSMVYDSGQLVNAVYPSDLILIGGKELGTPTNNINASSHSSGTEITIFRDAYGMSKTYPTVFNKWSDSEGTAWIIFDPHRNYKRQIMPAATCLFFIRASDATLGRAIPLSKVKQLSLGAFLIDADYVENFVNEVGCSNVVISCYCNGQKEYKLFDQQYDYDWLLTLGGLSSTMRQDQYLGITNPAIPKWSIESLVDNPLVKLVGNVTDKVISTSVLDSVVNPFYDESVLDHRTSGQYQRDTQSTGGDRIIVSTKQTFDPYIMVYHRGIKIPHNQVSQSPCVIDGEDISTVNLDMEVLDAAPYVDKLVNASETPVVTLPTDRSFTLYRVIVESRTTEPSLCKELYYTNGYHQVDPEDVGTLDEEAGTFTFNEDVVSDYAFVFEQGLYVAEIPIDTMLKSNSPLVFGNISMRNQAMLPVDSDVLVFLNGYELVEGVEYIRHDADVNLVKYGTEIYITTKDHILEAGNKLEIIYQRSLRTERVYSITMDENRMFAQDFPKRWTQVTIGGIANRNALTDTGVVGFSDKGLLMQARYMVPRNVEPVDEALLEMRRMVNQILHPAQPVKVVPVSTKPQIVSMYKQRLLNAATVALTDESAYTLTTEEAVLEWQAQFDAYKAVDAQVDACSVFPYLKRYDHALPKEMVHPVAYNLMKGIPYQN